MKWNVWSLYWLTWIVLGFGLPEFYAIGTGHPENTLSDQVWHLEGNGATFTRYVNLVLTVFLVGHMTWRWWR